MDVFERITPYQKGQFIRTAWYARGLEHGNPYYNKRFRVNAAETSLTPEWMYRSEARENGMMLIHIEEDLALLESAELYAEIWGGHPGTVNKRLSINGRSTYALPEVGTAAGHCTHSYPHIPLKLTDLVNGYNAVQFACDIGTGFWGHYIVDNAALNVVLKRQHPALAQVGLAAFDACVGVEKCSTQEETLKLNLSYPLTFTKKISSVDFTGYYSGYDENGNGMEPDWHGFTKDKEPVAILGRAMHPPFSITWDTMMLTAQENVAVCAVVHFRDIPNLIYRTPSTIGLHIPQRRSSLVTQHMATNQPIPFWSRAGKHHECQIILDHAPGRIEQAELHIVIWDGGAGAVQNPFRINGYAVPVAESGAHDVIYKRIIVDPALLLQGENDIILLSDTEHHGIEILLPGPCLYVRWRS
jgi:hypothetical protein